MSICNQKKQNGGQKPCWASAIWYVQSDDQIEDDTDGDKVKFDVLCVKENSEFKKLRDLLN